MDRKEFLISLGTTIFVATFPGFISSRKNYMFSFIRPPGSIEEGKFPKFCIRCGQCIRVCPSKCLKQVQMGKSLHNWMTPEIIPRQKGCILCQNCSKVCPTGAIRTVDQERIKIGTAVIYREECLVWTHKKECLVCLEFCPVQAIYLDEKGRPVVNPAICTGCGLCEQNCPVTKKDAAIRVLTAGERRFHIQDGKYY
ncbi:MAG TPA: 4Fe-4S dicluster domain-containing protein [bacterium]|nr:4Fe-4S dicluster domain-containing protein [bacterium]HPO52176.1 4Fe-4S dicluster domain-containing protein [bacterium]